MEGEGRERRRGREERKKRGMKWRGGNEKGGEDPMDLLPRKKNS